MSAPPALPAWLRALSWLLPPAVRDATLGDLLEEASTLRHPSAHRWLARQLCRIAAHHHAECYHDIGAARHLLLLALVATGLLLALPLAAATALAAAQQIHGTTAGATWLAPEHRAWFAPAAAGLLLGHARLPSRHLEPARWHLIALAAVAAAITGPNGAGWLSATVLAGLAALAHTNRQTSDTVPSDA